MNKNLQTFMEQLEKNMPGQVIRVTETVSPRFEIPAILHKIEALKKHPVILFERVRNLKEDISPFPVIINLFGSRERLAYAIDSSIQRLPFDFVEREKPVTSVVVDKGNAGVKDVVLSGDAIDLYDFPVLTHFEMDLGPYFTAGSVWIKDPEDGRVNCAIVRIYVEGPRRLVLNFNPARHTNHIFMKYKALGRPIPIAIVIGHHPAFYMGAQTKILAHEPDIIGGVMNEPLELTPSETWGEDFLVPAQAEIVIEAELSVTERDVEAPFGEYTQYYAGQKLNPVAEVKAVTHRRNACYLSIMPGYADHLLLDAPIIEAYLYNRIKAVVDGTIAVHVPVSGTARLHAYIQLRKSNDGEPKTAITTAISSDYRIKHVVVVDEDIDIFDDEKVLWAVATRSQWDKDLVVIPGMMGTNLDPSGDGTISTKGGIDATKPIDPRRFSKTLSLPDSVLEKINLEDYIDPMLLR